MRQTTQELGVRGAELYATVICADIGRGSSVFSDEGAGPQVGIVFMIDIIIISLPCWTMGQAAPRAGRYGLG